METTCFYKVRERLFSTELLFVVVVWGGSVFFGLIFSFHLSNANHISFRIYLFYALLSARFHDNSDQ